MALVDYTSSDEAETASIGKAEPPGPSSLKRKREAQDDGDLPPLPSKFHDLYASSARVSTRDDPSLHDGRKRVTPHIEGNWPTHIYVEWCPLPAEYTLLNKLTTKLKGASSSNDAASNIHSFLISDLGAPLPLHISLSRPIGFLTESKDDFLLSLQQSVKKSDIRPFKITCSGLAWVANFEKTRWFLVLSLRKPSNDGLNKMLHLSNRVVQEYGQPPLYINPLPVDISRHTGAPRAAQYNATGRKSSAQQHSEPRWDNLQDLSNAFHISIAWTLSQPDTKLQTITESLATEFLDDLQKSPIDITEVKAKVGNVVNSLPLMSRILQGQNLFEG
ncbi:U6 snRNA phosphodiesterase Usb1 [Amylocarpus encephaloides]|uniref:U6 snRNA phosphodiesterase n=1 Tax=Amylocarpus encephaloides TaxID=45428 RepID=A0A9P7YFE4_9HELO|nr:U6 snRNA phosphodiesterase Usb1 [Amylocarpus encephaloides]